ncbi:peroxynitrite isomerase Rv2717c [Andrographis paniculata]|uniref:peroxynitrite isomerase Rv2717c n=1 Tax=Andrographis paniculata TaxID=175694 RepID=UPI0021E73FB3|nr:peroxynitrite isomerase Rv2717c [Andrographis paniculata]
MAATPPPPPQVAVHPAVQPLAFLLGTWRGQGEGSFPTISPFRYSEELQFSHSPIKPVIAYSSKTWKLSSGEPMHSESGYWRPKLDGTIEVVVAQSTGLVEVQKGTYNAEQRSVNLKSDLVGNASKVKEIHRAFEMVDGELVYVVEMATNLTSLQTHLKAILKKV